MYDIHFKLLHVNEVFYAKIKLELIQIAKETALSLSSNYHTKYKALNQIKWNTFKLLKGFAKC